MSPIQAKSNNVSFYGIILLVCKLLKYRQQCLVLLLLLLKQGHLHLAELLQLLLLLALEIRKHVLLKLLLINQLLCEDSLLLCLGCLVCFLQLKLLLFDFGVLLGPFP